jgi:serine/threonine protein kinase
MMANEIANNKISLVDENCKWFENNEKNLKNSEDQKKGGAYGDVVLRDNTACKYARKGWSKDCSMTREILTLRSLRHPNIIEIQKILFDGKESLCMVTPRASVSLWDWWFVNTYQDKFKGEPYNLQSRINYIHIVLYQICRAFAHLHSLKILHRDYKSRNTVVTFGISHLPLVQIIDFGSCRMMGDPESLDAFTKEELCTCTYRAPELWRGATPSWSSDMYSIGVVFFELLAFESFIELKQDDRLVFEQKYKELIESNSLGEPIFTTKALKRFLNESGEQFSFASQNAMNLLLSLLQPDPTRRPRAIDCLNHAYFKNSQFVQDLDRIIKEQPLLDHSNIPTKLLLPSLTMVSTPRIANIKSLLTLKELYFRAASHTTTWIAFQFLEWIQSVLFPKQSLASRHKEPKRLALAMACHYNENFSLTGVSEELKNDIIRYLLQAAEERFIPLIPQLGIGDGDLENFIVWSMFCLGGTLEYHKREAHYLWKCLKERKSYPERAWSLAIGKIAQKLKNEYEIGLALSAQKILNWISTTTSSEFQHELTKD